MRGTSLSNSAPTPSTQQSRLHTTRPSAQVFGAAPLAHTTLQPAPSHRHFEFSLHVTAHAPLHFAWHSAELLQVMVLSAPTVASQSALLLHVTLVFAPPVKLHTALLAQVTTLFAPTVPLHVDVVSHVTDDASPTDTAHVAFCEQFEAQPLLVHVCVHEPFVQPHAALVHAQPAP